MLATQPQPLSGHQPTQGSCSSSRIPPQPKNLLATAITNHAKPNATAADWIEILQLDNKENLPLIPVKKESSQTDASLADDELKSDKKMNEKMLSERGLMLDLEMKEIVTRGELQNHLEIEVELKEIRLASMRVSRLRSLRDKEEEKR